MSSLRNSVHRRNHKERGQLASRQKLGLLEKKKDYLLRAKDYHSKQNRLKALREKALFRNPDEFYFKMISTKTKGGIHIQKRNEELPPEMVQLLKSQDQSYIKLQRDISKKKMERLRESIHFLDQGDDEDDDLEFDEDDDDEEMEPTPQKKPTHIVFVDNEEDVKKFDPVKHLDTLPELVNRKFNRPRVETLKKSVIATPESGAVLKALKKERETKLKELASRIEREEQLSRAEQELCIQKALSQKGRKHKVGVDKLGLPIYKWDRQRQK